jgi:hypothetical protein
MLNKYSTYYWHPGLTADEYMRYQEHQNLKYCKNADQLYDDYDDRDGYTEDY